LRIIPFQHSFLVCVPTDSFLVRSWRGSNIYFLGRKHPYLRIHVRVNDDPDSNFRNIYYGSGFTDSGGPAHLPGHTTADVALGKNIGESLSVSVTALNVANQLFLLDNSLTFAGGSHFFHPREIFAQIRYRFHY